MIIEERSQLTKDRAEESAKDMHLSLLRKGKPVFLNTSSSSMYPFIKGGDTIKISPVKEEEIEIGDVIAVDNKDKKKKWFYAHRVVKIFSEEGRYFYVTKGDAGRGNSDEPVRFDSIAGKVTEINRDGLIIGLERPFWRRLNRRIATASLRYPQRLRALSPWISLVMEWRWFFSKVGRRINTPLSNAEDIILICARSEIDEGLIKRAKELLVEGIDWDFLKEKSIKSAMPFLFFNSFNKINYSGIMPESILRNLKAGYLNSIPRITFQYEEAKELLNILFKNNIPAAPLKGPFLSRRFYGDITARGMSVDFDLLVEENNKTAARKLLEEAGYLFIPQGKATEWNQQWVFKKGDGILVELHWGIRPEVPSKEKMPGLWEGARGKDEDGVKYYELGEEELIILLSAHFIGSTHFGQLRYICDINELLAKYRNTLDWQEVIEKSKEWRLSNSVYAALLLSRSLFQSYIPGYALLGLKPSFFKRSLIRIVVNRNTVLRDRSIESRLMKLFLKYILLQMLEVSSLKDFTGLVFPPQDIMGRKTYLMRFAGGVKKLINVFRR